MFTKKFSRRFLAVSLAIVAFLFVSTVQAEVKTYIGVGEHYMESENETLAQAQNKAKEFAYLDVVEQASINVQSYSEMNNFNLTRDEIITITAGIVYPTDWKYSMKEEFDGLLVMRVEVTAEIDTDKIPELVEREIQLRANN